MALALVLWSPLSSARVFDFKSEKFAPYIKGTFVTTTAGDQAFATSSGTDSLFDKKNSYNSGYEFGFAYGRGGLRMRFGFEILRPQLLDGVSVTNAGGTELAALKSDVLGYAPKVGLEISLAEWKESRVYFSGEYGSASLTVKNTYTMTADGQAAFPGVVDFTEEMKGSSTMMDGALGYEVLLFDTTTLSFEVGYRQAEFASLTHNLPVTTFQGAVVKGDVAKNDDGTDRKYVLTNPFVSLAFRFWIF